MDNLLGLAKAFSEATRVRIICALLEQELCVCELCDALKVTQSTLSTHLQVIRAAGLIAGRKEGKWMYYQILPTSKRRIQKFLDFFGEEIRSHRLLTEDFRRLKRRISLRQNGLCCLGSGTCVA